MENLLIKYLYYFQGEGSIENGLFTSHLDAPYLLIANQTVNYLLNTQDKVTGGWPINVTRKFDKNTEMYLRSPWYSAMGQGHAISLLSRFYTLTKKEKYLNSAAKALDLFDVHTYNDGVKSFFMNSSSLVWYEEYPTQTHSLFVLNGFLYSMFGIYDFLDACYKSEIINENSLIQIYHAKAVVLFENGLRSLQQMLSLYDSGTRSFYDLRHVSNPKINPNIARWDYHMLHVSQLSYLINIIEQKDFKGMFNGKDLIDPKLLKIIRDRWQLYSIGVWNENSQIKT